MTKVFQFQPKVGQRVLAPVSGTVESILTRGIEIRTTKGDVVLLDPGSVRYHFVFATFDDAVFHLSLLKRITHCERFYFAFCYGVDLLSSTFTTQL